MRTDFDPRADAEHGESQDSEHVAEERVHLEAVSALALLHDLLEQVLWVEGYDAVRRVVEANGLERHSGKMMGLKLGEELQLISCMLRARVGDVVEVAGELLLRVCCHFCCRDGEVQSRRGWMRMERGVGFHSISTSNILIVLEAEIEHGYLFRFSAGRDSPSSRILCRLRSLCPSPAKSRFRADIERRALQPLFVIFLQIRNGGKKKKRRKIHSLGSVASCNTCIAA